MAWLTVTGVISGAALLGALAWIWLLAESYLHRDLFVLLETLPTEPPPTGWPSLAVAFAARDEAAEGGTATRSLLAQDYPGLEVIAVDDRSKDDTGAILDALALEDSKLRVIHIRELPDGWLGKTHALQAASTTTSADWLLFTDADVVFTPETLQLALALAVRENLDHLTVIPEMLTESLGERAFLAMFFGLFTFYCPPWRLNDPGRKAAMGVGAFNLVRAEAFRAVGGFGHVALSLDDDMRLAQVLKFAGYVSRAVVGRHCLSVRWHAGLGAMVRGLEKNFFAGLDFNVPLVALAVLGMIVLGILPHVGVLVGPLWVRAVCAGGVASAAVFLGASRGLDGLRWYHAFFLPLGATALIVALVRSVVMTFAKGGVRWRDHLYPLAALKEHVRRRNAWANEVWRSTR
jgi:hypothetical protein